VGRVSTTQRKALFKTNEPQAGWSDRSHTGFSRGHRIFLTVLCRQSGVRQTLPPYYPQTWRHILVLLPVISKRLSKTCANSLALSGKLLSVTVDDAYATSSRLCKRGGKVAMAEGSRLYLLQKPRVGAPQEQPGSYGHGHSLGHWVEPVRDRVLTHLTPTEAYFCC
jgi:hypothetical protein